MNTAAQSKSKQPVNAIISTVLIADKFNASGIDTLRALGHEVISEPGLDIDSLPDAIMEHDPGVLVVRSTKVSAKAIQSSSNLELIVRAGAGIDNIDADAASRQGVFVSNCPGQNSIAVAELAWGLILACDRRIPDQVADLKDGSWRKKEYSKAQGLHGRTLGIIGLGRIGQEIAARGRAFGMRVIAWSRSLDQEKADAMDVDYCESLMNLVRMSDVISVNVSANDETKCLLDAEYIAAMKSGAYLINTSRGAVIDQEALANAVQEQGIRVGLDVFADEPTTAEGEFTDDIVNLSGVYGTHHVGASTEQAQKAITDRTIEIIRKHLETGETINCVNLAHETGTAVLMVRHYNRPGVLAHVFYILGQSGINVEEMNNVIYHGGEAACARIRLSAAPSKHQLDAINANEHVLATSVTGIS